MSEHRVTVDPERYRARLKGCPFCGFILLYGVAPTLGDQADHLLRARLTPDVAGYSWEMPVCPAFGRLLERVFRSEPQGPLTCCDSHAAEERLAEYKRSWGRERVEWK